MPNYYNNLKISAGFTLIEMIVVITILVLITISALPSFKNFIANNNARNIADRLASTFRRARMEAINSGNTTIVCQMQTGQSFQNNICIPSNVWNAWALLIDKNSNSAPDDKEVIMYYENIPQNTVFSNSNNYVKYDSSRFCKSGGHVFNIQPSADVLAVMPVLYKLHLQET